MAFDAGAVIGRLELGLEGWKKSVEAVKKDQESMTGFAMRHGQEIQDLGKKFALAGAAITAALSAVVISTARAGDEFDEMSARTGISTEMLSTLKLAADKSGTSMGDVARGMKFLAAQMIETSTAGDKSKTVLGAMGIEATDAAGKLRPMNEVLFDAAEKFKGMEDGAIKIRLAVALFGRSGMDLIPILNLGSEGLKKNEEAARRLGIEWSGPSAKAAAAFRDMLIDLKASGTGLNKTIGEALIPITQKFIEHATDAIVKVKDWAKENPELSKSILSFAGAGGVALTVMGTLLIAIGTLAKNLQLLKISASVPIIITVGIAVGLALPKALEEIRDFYEKNVSHRYIAQEDRDWQGLIRTLGEWSTIAESIHDAFTKQNGYSIESGKILGQLDVIWQKYGNSTQEAMEAILKGEAGPKVKQLLIDLMNAHGGAAQLAGVHAEAEKKVEKAAVALDPALQAILDSLDKGKEKTKTLAEELNLTFTSSLKKRVEDIAEALKKYGDDLPESEVRRLKAEQRELNDNLATGGLVLGMVEQRLKLLEKPLEVITAHMEGLGKIGAEAAGKMGIESRNMVEPVKSAWQECSTVISDSMRDIAKSIVDAFGLVEALAYKPIDWEKTGMADYFKNVFDELEKDYGNRKDLLNKFYSDSAELADEAYDAENLVIRRREEDEDRQYKRAYDREREAIRNSSMNQTEKDAALLALEISYEDAKLRREREREDAKIKREEAHEIEMERIREEGLQKLLDLQNEYQKEQDRIRKDEDKARDKHAQDELDRQNSLWEKVKTVFGTACENMATIFLTKMFEPVGDLAAKLAKKLIGKGTDSVADALDGVGKSTENLGKTIGDFIGGIGKGIGTFIIEITSAIGTGLVTIATAIAEAATILAAAAGPLAIVLAIAAAAYLTFGLISAFLASIGKGGKDSDLAYWLKMIHENIQELHDFMLSDTGFRGYMNSLVSDTISIKEKIEDIRGCVCGPMLDALKGLAGYQHGGYVPETGLALLHAGEYVLPPAANQGFVNAAAPAMAALGISSAVNNYSITIQAIDGPSVERLFKGRGRDIIEQMFRQNKKGLTRNVNKFLEDMA